PGGQAAHFTVSYLLLSACLLLSITLLERIAGASAWWLAGTPAIVYYAGLNWDLLAIAPLIAAVRALSARRATRGGLWAGLAVAVKVFPLALLPAASGALSSGKRSADLLRFL